METGAGTAGRNPANLVAGGEGEVGGKDRVLEMNLLVLGAGVEMAGGGSPARAEARWRKLAVAAVLWRGRDSTAGPVSFSGRR